MKIEEFVIAALRNTNKARLQSMLPNGLDLQLHFFEGLWETPEKTWSIAPEKVGVLKGTKLTVAQAEDGDLGLYFLVIAETPGTQPVVAWIGRESELKQLVS